MMISFQSAERLGRYWWAIALRGVVAIIFGILAFAWPGLTISVLVLIWGAFALVDGILTGIAGFQAQGGTRWALLFEGLVGIAAGVLTFVWPGLTALVLLYIIAAWALVTGVLEIIAAIRLRQVIDNEWMMVLSGVASVLFGIALVVNPTVGALAVAWLIGAYAIVIGVLMLVLAFRLRGMNDQQSSQAAAA
jgi:uncharacterized membrane protein HdeD (DUF308 family)